jgi:hypothetical protein
MKNKKQPNKKLHWFERYTSTAIKKLIGRSGEKKEIDQITK